MAPAWHPKKRGCKVAMATIRRRKQKDGTTRFQAVVKRAGFPIARGTFGKEREARDWALKTENDMREGRYNLTSEADRHTVRETIARYLDDVLPKKSTRRRYLDQQRQQLGWWLAEIGHYTLGNLSKSVLAGKRDELAKKYKAGTVNRYLAALSHVFTIACDEWEWLPANPLGKVRKEKEGNSRLFYLTLPELDRVLEQAAKCWRRPLVTIITLAIATGARKSEVLGMKWADVDLERGMILLEEQKNNERGTLYLADYAKAELQRYMAAHPRRSKFVFPSIDGKQPMRIDREMRRAFDAAGLKHFRFHDTRHTAGSWLAMSGASASEIAEVLRHKSLNMVKRYAHLSKTHTANVVSTMNDRVFTTQKEITKENHA